MLHHFTFLKIYFIFVTISDQNKDKHGATIELVLSGLPDGVNTTEVTCNCYDKENIQISLHDTIDVKQYSFDIREQLKQRPPVPPPIKTE